jgi:hypothetical protein
MHNPFRKPFYYLLLLMEVGLSLGLGVFGNKIAEHINITPTLLALGTGLCITLLLVVTILVLSYENEKRFPTFPASAGQFKVLAVKAVGFLFERVVTVFPFALISGVVVGLLVINFVPEYTAVIVRVNIRIPRPALYLTVYDLLALVVVIIALYAINSKKHNSVLLLTYALGFAGGFWGTTLIFRSGPNNNFLGLGFMYVIVSFIAMIVRSEAAQGLIKDINNLFRNITEKR